MIILQAQLVSAVMSSLTFVLVTWIAYSLHRNSRERDIPLSKRLRHPVTSTEELRDRCEQERTASRAGERDNGE